MKLRNPVDAAHLVDLNFQGFAAFQSGIVNNVGGVCQNVANRLLAMTEDNPDYESGQVSGVLQKGYTLNGKVIRPSMVKVNN